METQHPYELLSELVAYPGPNAVGLAERCRAMLQRPESASLVEAFGTYAASIDGRELEELYTRSFDFHPPHCLEVGFQLFGESYKRGAFLVKVQAAAKEQSIACEGELPDHLSVQLKLLAKLPYPEARGLADEAVLPALNKVLGAFPDEANPYRMLLEATKGLLQADFKIEQIRLVPDAESVLSPPGLKPMGPPIPANRHDDLAGGLR